MTDYALTTLTARYDTRPDLLTFLGGGSEDSDSIVYSFPVRRGKMALKIKAIPQDNFLSLRKLDTRLRFADYLGKNGMVIACPVKDSYGNLYETFYDHNTIYVSYMMQFHEGKNPKCAELNGKTAESWGKLTGKTHRISKDFSKNLASASLFGWDQEIEFFSDLCKDPEIRQKWQDLHQQFSLFPHSPDDLGFIHNDNHQRHLLVSGSNLTLLDFEVANLGFFMSDIATTLQGMLFDYGGMHCPCTKPEPIKRFVAAFLNGYEQENHLAPAWLNQFETFVSYRRLLLFTVLQDSLNTKPALKEALKAALFLSPTSNSLFV
ncbi:MAG: phosphotransferase [Negativicutes bacterium]|nr:phosphotransferase [Negativicutes bacterium]